MSRRLANSTLLVLLLLSCACLANIQPLGSILFEDNGFPKSCFAQNDIAMLATRLKFQQLLPKDVELMNDDAVMAMVKYFYGINEIIERSQSHELLQKCFYDTLGGYLKHIVLPITKYSFYAGNVSLSTAQKVSNLYDRCKELLNTNGNSWSEPITDFSKLTIKILPVSISIEENDAMKACASLIMNNDDELMVSLPKIETDESSDDDDDELSTTLKLPFKRDQSYFNINSKRSAFALFRYFVTVSQCFAYQGVDQSAFNRRFKMWINEYVLQYLDDNDLYPAFGAVLRILESIKDSHDATYHGTKDRKAKRQRQLHSMSLFANEESDEFSFDDKNRDVYWWMSAVLASIGIFFLACLIVFLFVKICKNAKKIKQTEGERSKRGTSLKDRIVKALKSGTHKPERDEYYQYKRVPQSVKYENEKGRRKIFSKLRGKDKSREKIQLPRLNYNALDSDDDIVLHDSNISLASTSNAREAVESSEESKRRKDKKKKSVSINPRPKERK